MHLAERDIGGLVFGEYCSFATVGDFGCTAYDYPVLCPVMMLLQAQAGFGLDLNALDLAAASFVDAVVPAPGSVHFAVQSVFFALL